MNHVPRWSEPQGGASGREIEILAAAEDPSPPPGAEHLVWTSLAAVLGGALPRVGTASADAAATNAATATGQGSAATNAATATGRGAAATSAATATSSTATGAAFGTSGVSGEGAAGGLAAGTAATVAKPVLAVVVKAFAIGALGGSLVAGAGVWRVSASGPSSPPVRRLAPSATSAFAAGASKTFARTPEAPQPPAGTTGDERASAGEDRRPPTVVPSLKPQGASTLEEEARMVRDARMHLRDNDATGALAMLDAADARFRRGAMQQEREALRIESLAKAGRTHDAEVRARAFLRAFPDSPHEARVRRFVH